MGAGRQRLTGVLAREEEPGGSRGGAEWERSGEAATGVPERGGS